MEEDRLIDRVINSLLIFGSLMGIISFILSYLINLETEYGMVFYSDSLVLAIMIGITIFRKKISRYVKSVTVLTLLFALIFTDIFHSGIYAANVRLMVLIPFFCFLIFGLRKTVIIYLLSIIIITLIGYFFSTESLQIKTDLNHRVTQFDVWLIHLTITTMVAFLILIIEKNFHESFLSFIDSLKRKNIELAESEQSYREIFNATADAIILYDLEGNILEVNQTMIQNLGYEQNEIKDLSIHSISAANEGYTQELALTHIKDARDKGNKKTDWKLQAKNGRVFWVEISLKRTFILGKDRILAVITDIDEKKKTALQLELYKNQLEQLVSERTEKLELANQQLTFSHTQLIAQNEELQSTLKQLKDAQEQLMQAEKMASLGVLSAGVAHEINNPLNFIQGGLTGLEEFFNEQPELKNNESTTLLQAIREGIDRASAIVTSLNQFSRQSNSIKEKCQVHAIIENCLQILQSQFKNKIEIKKEYCSPNPVIYGNSGKLHQAFLNILINAEQAISTKGIISIKTLIIGNSLHILFADSGEGIDKQIINRITEPFFTTKEPGKGTGLGLSITYNIITELDGKLAFNSEKSKGTDVTIVLPLIQV
ncbi:MAG: PAS domain S-box protein [Bacteroidota bacterium]|nr:MAG: PAS domain S-box protein [Bacteroidota bacterium]